MTLTETGLHVSDVELDNYAQRFIGKFFPENLKVPKRIDFNKLIEILKEKFSFDFKRGDLDYSDGSKILGSTNFKERYIAIDNAFFCDDFEKAKRLPFVIAHEVAHCIIHSRYYPELKKLGVFDEKITDTWDVFTGKKILQTERDFLEHQANVFAARILVPKDTLQIAVIKTQKKLSLSRNVGYIYLDTQRYSRRDYSLMLSDLSIVYGVSRELIKIRLFECGLIIGQKTNVYSLRDIIKEIFSN